MGQWSLYTSRQLKPAGWLKRQLEIQAAGLSGHLDRIWPDVRDSAWIGGSREGWERVPYWLDGFIPLAYLLENSDMIARAKRYIDAILAAQLPDGWICPCREEEREHYDTWAVLLITKVLTVYYDCSGDERIPEAVYRVLKNYYDLLKSGQIHLFDWGRSRWFEGCIAISFTYERRPEPWLRELAAILKEQGADYNDFIPLWKRPLNRWRQETHIVNLAMMLKHEAVSCELLGESYTDNAEALRAILAQYNGTPVGLFTGDECLSGLSPIQGTELCAVVEQMYSYELLYAHTGESKWMERLERLAFNALPATVSDDMWTHQYVQMSNQIACQRFPGKSLFRTNDAEAHLFGLEPHFGCCTANFNQGWPKLALSAFMHRENTIISCLPVPSRLTTDAADILLQTNYPFGNRFTYTVSAAEDITFLIRIPSFARCLRVDGQPADGRLLRFAVPAGSRRVISLSFDAEVRFEPRPYGLRAVTCGSLVFSVPVAYEMKMYEYEKNGVERKFPYCDYEYLPRSAWNYAFCGADPAPEYRGVGDVPFSSQQPPVVLRARVQEIGWGLEDGYEAVCAKTPQSLVPLSAEEEILLWPYGCTRLRMTELPLLEP